MCWSSLYHTISRDKKTWAAAKALGVKRCEIIGRLVEIWCLVLPQNRDGSLEGFSNEVLAEEAEWDGDADAFIQALVDAGWVDSDEHGRPVRLHNAERYNECHRRSQRQRKRRAELKNNEAPQKSASRKTARRTKPIEPAPEPPAPQEVEVIDVRGELVQANDTGGVDAQRWEEAEETTKNTKPKELPRGSARDKPAVPIDIFLLFKNTLRQYGKRYPLYPVGDQLEKIRALIDAHPARAKLGWWGDVLDEIDRSKYLRGEVNGLPLTLPWLLQEENLQKVATGAYRDRQRRDSPQFEIAAAASRMTQEQLEKYEFTPDLIQSHGVGRQCTVSLCCCEGYFRAFYGKPCLCLVTRLGSGLGVFWNSTRRPCPGRR